VHAAAGVMRVNTDHGTWVVPPGRGVWVPPGLGHDVHMVTAVQMRTLYIVRAALPRAPARSCVVPVSALLRELILEALRLPRPYPLGGPAERLFGVMLEQIRFEQVLPLHLPLTASASLRTLIDALQQDPSDARTLAAWGRTLHRSERTLARAFRAQTGLTFAAWRTQLRLLRSLEGLAQGRSVTEVALDAGYDSTSAFIHVFRRHLGQTPSRYFDQAA